MWGSWTYLILDCIALFPVLALSYDKWVKFIKLWPIALKSIALVGVVFIVWDIWFTVYGVWEFNPEFLIGLNIINLPIEEWLFFLVIPWVCAFIMHTFHVHFGKWIAKLNLIPLYYILLTAVIVGFFSNFGAYYTTVNFALGMVVLLTHIITWPKYTLNLFMLTYLTHLIPFYLINGVLTSDPVVIYNNAENLSIRVGTIPIEDFIYSYNLIGMVAILMRWFKRNQLWKRHD